ncbi:hypothetical protein V8E36_000372, partial [Tilletia maclaganii]
SSSAAARLTARFSKLTSISQGRASTAASATDARATHAAAATSKLATSKLSRIVPLVLKNGITLIKDRRLIDTVFHGKKLGPIFEEITERERLRVRPVIPKDASARVTTNIIMDAFLEQGHDLVCDGWSGFEYAHLTQAEHRLMTLGRDKPKQGLSATELAVQYLRRECFIVVMNGKKKFGAYDPFFFEMMGKTISDDDDNADSELADSPEDLPNDFGECFFCCNTFSVDVLENHQLTCTREDSGQQEIIVKKEPARTHLEAPRDQCFSTPASRRSSTSMNGGACICGKPDDDEVMVGCDGDGCDIWRHKSCVGSKKGYRNKDWFCDDCLLKQPRDENDPGAGNQDPKKHILDKKRKSEGSPAKRVSSRLRPG